MTPPSPGHRYNHTLDLDLQKELRVKKTGFLVVPRIFKSAGTSCQSGSWRRTQGQCLKPFRFISIEDKCSALLLSGQTAAAPITSLLLSFLWFPCPKFYIYTHKSPYYCLLLFWIDPEYGPTRTRWVGQISTRTSEDTLHPCTYVFLTLYKTDVHMWHLLYVCPSPGDGPSSCGSPSGSSFSPKGVLSFSCPGSRFEGQRTF